MNIANQSNNDDSEDDEEVNGSSIDFINNGSRGIIVFRVCCVKKEHTKIFHFNIHNGVIHQYVEKKRKTLHCQDIQSITFKANDFNCVVEIKKNTDMISRQKRYLFESGDHCLRYKQYIEFYKEFGELIKLAFDFIDRKGSTLITINSLQAALKSLDMNVSDEIMRRM